MQWNTTQQWKGQATMTFNNTDELSNIVLIRKGRIK